MNPYAHASRVVSDHRPIGCHWKPEEDEIIRRNLDLADGAIAAILRANGRYRTTSSVKHRRHTLGLTKQSGANLTPEHREAALGHLKRAAEALSGWPMLHGSPAVRDRQFVRSVMIAAIDAGLISFTSKRSNREAA
jgi:hypothetical protein